MHNVTIVLPVSRPEYLQQVFSRLEILTCDRARTNLLVIVDGDDSLFVTARNMTEMSKFGERLCVQFKSKHKLRHFDYLGRRLRISDIHNFAKQHIQGCEFVFGIEDDTIVPTNTLTKLLKNYSYEPFAGFIQGVELGRWGIPYVGAWKADDIYEPTKITSTQLMTNMYEVDAGGFYCFITKSETYVNHEFKPFENNALGPDVDFGMTLRRDGMVNFTDYSIHCIHKSKDKDITILNTVPTQVQFVKKDGRWRQQSKF